MTRPEIALTLDSDAGVLPAGQSAPSSAVAPSPSSASKCAVMDAAYTEFLRLQEKGEPLDLEAFCAGFPDCRSSLLRLLTWHQFIDDNPAYLQGRADTSWPKVGERYGDLTLLRELGRGSFSRVFLATEASTGDRLVVVKFSERGDAEARTQGPLSHPHIVPVLSASRDEATGLTAVRMPYLGSATLEDVLDRACPPSSPAPSDPERARAERPRKSDVIAEPPGPERARAERSRKADVIADALRACAQPEDSSAAADPRLRTGNYADGVIHLAGQLAGALAFLHAQGVCHRDLKPSNVLLDPSGKPLLLDFNLSTSERETALPTGGTLRYMAPEQIRAFLGGDSENLDERADLFALAVMVYELLAGDHPYGPIPAKLTGAPLAQFLLEQFVGGFRPLREACPDVERPVARALERCLAFDPTDRPQSAAELATELKRQFSPARRARRWLTSHPLAVRAALCLLLCGGMAAGLAWSVTPPYSERQYQQGLKAYRAGDYDEAERYFDRAFQADPKNGRYRFARGVTRLKRSKFLPAAESHEKLVQAWNDLKVIVNGEPDAPTIALEAYLLNREQNSDKAINLYTHLLQGSYRRAMVLNNQAYSYRLRNSPGDFDLAFKDLDEAAQLDPNCQAIYCNRATLVSLHWLGTNVSWHRQALDDIDRAIQLGPTTWKLYSDAARLYALAARDDLYGYEHEAARAAGPSLLGVPPLMAALHARGQHRIERCLSHVSEAITRGDPTAYSRHPDFRFLQSHFVFPADPQPQPQATASAINLYLIDPVELSD